MPIVRAPLPALLLACLLVLGACRAGTPGAPEVAGAPEPAPPRTVQPGAPGEPARVLQPGHLSAIPPAPHTEADVRFMRGMIPHHVQALEMAALVEERTDRPEIHLIARRIALSQRDEIALMQRWLAARHEPPGDEHAHHAHGDHAYMPGMLTAADMQRLAAARGTAFDRLFLEYMIMHHQGAIIMVAELFSTPGAAQEPELYQFAAHVDADQQMEIERMRRLLGTLPQP